MTPVTATAETGRGLGWDSLRPLQVQAIDALAGGRDAVVVMPPGSGKSAVFQVAGMQIGGLTVVVSPLLALQRDQVTALRQRIPAADVDLLNGELSAKAHRAVIEGLAGLRFLYLGPEQLGRDDVAAALAQNKPSLIAVDEAHCISQWGHDFRPEYLRLGRVVEALGHPPVCACTATASPPVRAEITTRLGLDDPALVIGGFDRPNISLDVTPPLDSAEAKRTAIVERAAAIPKPAIVYVATRAETAELADELTGLGLAAAAYHGAETPKVRAGTEHRWLRGELDVIVATTAFGMGVDKPDVRAVIHADPPESLDAFLQEIGRSGRDGQAAEAVLVWRPEDLGVRRFFAGGLPSASSLVSTVNAVRAADRPVTEREIAGALGWTVDRVSRLLDLLLQTGHLTVTGDGWTAVGDTPATGAAGQARDLAVQRREVEDTRIELVRAFAETRDCRRQLLLASFGEILETPCGNCDRCWAGLPAEEHLERPYPLGSTVHHQAWGTGLVIRYEGSSMTVLFDTAGYRTLDLETVAEHHLLRPG